MIATVNEENEKKNSKTIFRVDECLFVNLTMTQNECFADKK